MPAIIMFEPSRSGLELLLLGPAPAKRNEGGRARLGGCIGGAGPRADREPDGPESRWPLEGCEEEEEDDAARAENGG